MKIILYRDGKPGVIVSVPGDDPMVELGELLEGEVELTPINNRLALVARADGEELRLPIRYALDKLGEEPLPIAGDAAVVVRRPDGMLGDTGIDDLRKMEGRMVCVNG